MAYFQDADIETMLDDWGNLLTAGGVSAPCALDEREAVELEIQGGGGQVGLQIVATIRTTDFPALAANDEIEVDGEPYRVWRQLKLGDGALSEIWLRKESEGS